MTPAATKLIEYLAFQLRKHGQAERVKGSLRAQSVPLVTDKSYRDTPLRVVMSPETPTDPHAAEQLFDLFLWPLVNGGGDPIAELAAVNQDLADFVAKGENLHTQVTLLLYALSNAPGASLGYGKNSIMVMHGAKTFGIDHGVVQSRFSKGHQIGVFDPRPTLEWPTPLLIRNLSFCSLYREAYRRGLEDVLLALYVGQPNFDFKKLAREAIQNLVPRKQNLKRWEKAIMSGQDPIASLYKNMVPEWMTKMTFVKLFGQASRRPTQYPYQKRQMLLNKLLAHFYKNKKENNQ